MSLEYVCLAAFRVLSTVFVQNGYVHPDEFFQTTEIITGKFLVGSSDANMQFGFVLFENLKNSVVYSTIYCYFSVDFYKLLIISEIPPPPFFSLYLGSYRLIS